MTHTLHSLCPPGLCRVAAHSGSGAFLALQSCPHSGRDLAAHHLRRLALPRVTNPVQGPQRQGLAGRAGSAPGLGRPRPAARSGQAGRRVCLQGCLATRARPHGRHAAAPRWNSMRSPSAAAAAGAAACLQARARSAAGPGPKRKPSFIKVCQRELTHPLALCCSQGGRPGQAIRCSAGSAVPPGRPGPAAASRHAGGHPACPTARPAPPGTLSDCFARWRVVSERPPGCPKRPI